LWAEQGYLETTPGASIDYELIAERLKDVFEDYQVTKIAFDRWNYPHLRPWLVKVGFSEQLLARTFIELDRAWGPTSLAAGPQRSAILGRVAHQGQTAMVVGLFEGATGR
jgi:phage terminase large subunit-like protein